MARKVKIEIRDDVNSVEGTLEVKSSEDFPLSLNFSVADIKNIKDRTSSFTKTFLIPASKENNKLLNSLYDANLKDHKDSRNRKIAIILVGEDPILDGDLRIKKAIGGNKPEEYQAILVGDNGDWALALKEKNIADFDYNQAGSPTHVLTQTLIESSWNSSFSAGFDFVYPLINYGQWNRANQARVGDLRPAIYIKAILKKAFDSINYTIVSTFLDTANFERLNLPFVGDGWKISDAAVTARKFSVGLSFQQIETLPNGPDVISFFQIKFDDENLPHFDNDNNFNTSTNRFVVVAGKEGMYKFKVGLSVFFQDFSGSVEAQPILRIRRNGTIVRFIALAELTEIGKGQQNTTSFSDLESNFIFMDTNDTAEITLGVVSSGRRFGSPNLAIVVPQFTIPGKELAVTEFSNEPDNGLLRGNTVTIKDVLDSNITVMNIIKDITRMFNLFWRTDVKKKTVFVEPRDDF